MDLEFLRKNDFSGDKAWKRAFDLTLAVWRVTADFKTADQPPAEEEMLKNKLRRLASGVISDLAPKKIFDDSPEKKLELIFEAARKIEDLRAHLRLAQNLRLTREINCQVLDKEFRLLKEELLKEALGMAEIIESRKTERVTPKYPKIEAVPAEKFDVPVMTAPAVQAGGEISAYPASAGLAVSNVNRLDKIADHIREKRILQLKDLINFFPDVSEKTIRNDLKQLCERNLIERVGNGAGSYYRLI